MARTMWLLCGVCALAVQLSAHTKADSTIDGHAAAAADSRMKDIGGDISDLKSKLNTAISDSTRELNVIIREGMSKSGEKEAGLRTLVGESTTGIAKTDVDVNSFRQASTREAGHLKKESNVEYQKMNELNLKVMGLGSSAMKVVEDTGKEYTDEVKEVSDQNGGEWKDVLDEITDEIQEGKDEANEEIETAADSSTEGLEVVNDKIDEASEADTEVFEEQEEVQAGTEEVDKETNLNIKSMEKVNMREAERIEKLAKKSGLMFKEQRKKDERDAERGIGKLQSQAEKEMKSVGDATDDWSNQLIDQNEDKAHELDKTRKETFREIQSERLAFKKASATFNLEQVGVMLDTNTALSLQKDEVEALDDAKEEQMDDDDEKLNDLEDKSAQGIATSKGDLANKESELQQEMESASTEMKDVVTQGLNDGKGVVTEEVENNIAGLNKRVGEERIDILNGVEGLTSEAVNLGYQIKNDKSRVAEYTTQAQTSDRAVRERGDIVAEHINETKGSVLETVTGLQQAVRDRMEHAVDHLEVTTNKTADELGEEADRTRENLQRKVSHLLEDATDQIARSDRSIASASSRGHDVMAGMKLTIGNMDQLKEAIDENLPLAKQTVAEAQTVMTGLVSETEQKLSNMHESASARIKIEDENMREKTNALLGESRGEVSKTLEKTGEEMQGLVEEMSGSIHDLKQQSGGDYSEFMKYSDQLRRQISGARKFADDAQQAAEKNNMMLTDRLKLTNQALSGGLREQDREGSILQKTAARKLAAAHAAEFGLTEKEMAAVLAAANGDFSKFEGSAADVIKATLAKVNEYMSAKYEGYDGLKHGVNVLASMIGKTDQILNGKESAAQGNMANLVKYLGVLDGKTREAEEQERQLFLEQKEELRALQEKMVGDLTREEKLRLATLTQVVNTKEAEEATRQKLALQRRNALIDGFNQDLDQKLGGINGAIGQVRWSESELYKGVHDMVSNLQSEAGGVGSAMLIGEDAVKRSEMDEERTMSKAMDGDLSNLEGTLNIFQNAKGMAGSDLEHLDQEFAKELQMRKAEGAAQAERLHNEITRVMNNAPDFSAMFVEDTESAKEEMAAAHTRLDEGETWSKGVMSNYAQKFDTLKTQREKQSMHIHNKSSTLKREVVDRAAIMVNSAQGMRDYLGNSQDEFRNQQFALKKKLRSLSGVSSNHDSGEVEQMEKSHYALAKGHDKFMDWLTHFKHHTFAWREEVEHQLRKSGRDIGGGDEDAANARLESEIGMNDALRAMQLRVEDRTAETAKDESHAFGALAGQMGAGVQNVLHLAYEGASQKSAAQRQAQDTLDRQEKSQDDIVQSVKDSQNRLEKLSAETTEKTSRTVNMMRSKFMLPKLSGNEFNRDSQEKFEKLSQQLNAMSAEQSLLEEHATTLRGSPTSLLQAEEAEEVAVARLNEELEAQNSKLSSQNNKLESTVTNHLQRHPEIDELIEID